MKNNKINISTNKIENNTKKKKPKSNNKTSSKTIKIHP